MYCYGLKPKFLSSSFPSQIYIDVENYFLTLVQLTYKDESQYQSESLTILK